MADGTPLFDRALEGIPDRPNSLWFKARTYHQVGDTEAGDTWLERLMTLARDGSGQLGEPASMILGWALPWVSYFTGTDRDLDLAERTAKAAPDTFQGMLGLAMLAVVSSDAEAAAEQYKVVRFGPRFIERDLLLGLLAHTMGKFDVDSSHFEDALDFSRKAGYRSDLAEACYDYADTLRGRDGDGDREKATALLNEALSIARDLGMRPLEAQAVDRLEQLEARAAAPLLPRRPDPARGRGPAAYHRGRHQPGHRRRSLHHHQHRRQPRQEHSEQVQHGESHRGRNLRRPPRPGRGVQAAAQDKGHLQEWLVVKRPTRNPHRARRIRRARG